MNSGIDDLMDRQMALLDELRRAERQAAMSYIASLIAHSIGTPLNVIVGRAGLIRKHSGAVEAIVNDAKCIEQKVEQLAAKLRHIVEILAWRESPAERCDIDVVLVAAFSLYEPIARTRNATLKIERPRTMPGKVDRDQMFVVLTSLLSLALHDVSPGATIDCTVAWADPASPRCLSIGLGIPGCTFPDPRALEKIESPSIAEPRSANRMQVLGMCFALLRNIGGSLEVRTTNPNSTHIGLRWPIEDQGPLGVV